MDFGGRPPRWLKPTLVFRSRPNIQTKAMYTYICDITVTLWIETVLMYMEILTRFKCGWIGCIHVINKQYRSLVTISISSVSAVICFFVWSMLHSIITEDYIWLLYNKLNSWWVIFAFRGESCNSHIVEFAVWRRPCICFNNWVISQIVEFTV